MGTDPKRNVGEKNLPALPYDHNNFRPAVLVAAIVQDGEVVGYLPLDAEDQGNGTAILKVKSV